MILSFGPDPGALSPLAVALSTPSVVALLCYVGASMSSERFAAGLRKALLVGWIAQGLSIVIDLVGVGSDVPGARFGFAPALSITVWFVLAVYELESRFVPLPGARRALAACGVVVVILAWIYPGQVHAQASSVLGAPALAARASPPTACSAWPSCMPCCSIAPSGRCAAPGLPRRRRPTACPSCAWSA